MPGQEGVEASDCNTQVVDTQEVDLDSLLD